MFARKVSMHLKNDGAQAFKQKIENEIVPLLRKQKGFLDEITFLYQAEKKFMPSVCGRLRNTQRHTTVERIPSDEDPGVRG